MARSSKGRLNREHSHTRYTNTQAEATGCMLAYPHLLGEGSPDEATPPDRDPDRGVGAWTHADLGGPCHVNS